MVLLPPIATIFASRHNSWPFCHVAGRAATADGGRCFAEARRCETPVDERPELEFAGRMTPENRTEDDAAKPAVENPSISLSHDDEVTIHSLSQELDVPNDQVTETYRRELARLRKSARVTLFLPLVVSHRVRQHIEATHAR